MIIFTFFILRLDFFRRDETARPVFGYYVHQNEVDSVPCAADVRNGGVVDRYGKVELLLRLYDRLEKLPRHRLIFHDHHVYFIAHLLFLLSEYSRKAETAENFPFSYYRPPFPLFYAKRKVLLPLRFPLSAVCRYYRFLP